MMLWDYKETISAGKQLGSTSFRKIVKAITCKDQKIKQAVDYVLGVLMYDNFAHLRSVVATSAESEFLNGIVNALEAFIETMYENHIATCEVTNINFSLSDHGSGVKRCDTCCFASHVLEYIKLRVNPEHAILLNDAIEKLKLFFSHCVRVLNQLQ